MREEALQERKGKEEEGMIQKQDQIGLKEILRKEKLKEQEGWKDKDQAATLIVN